MNNNSTLVGKSSIALTLIFSFFVLFTSAQSPTLQFNSPELSFGNAGQQGAIYKFKNVVIGVDAFIKLRRIENGAFLINMDDSTSGYYEAWQPVVGGPSTIGNDSYIKWDISFKTTAGSNYSFPSINMSAIDIDGDDVKVKEYIRVKGYSSYSVAPITLMQISTISNGDDDASADSTSSFVHLPVLQGIGPIDSRPGISVAATDVRLNFKVNNRSYFEITTGSIVVNNANSGAMVTNRNSSFYFKDLTIDDAPLPVTYKTFSAVANDKSVNLYWITDTERGHNHFEVERSFDQVNFSTIGMVLDAQSVTSGGRQYSFKDQSTELIGKSLVYYRLKQVDADGRFTYSVIKMVRFTSITKAFVQVSPNPYMDKLNVNFISEDKGKAEIRLMSFSGQVIANKQSEVNKGYNNIQLLNLNSIAPGIYIVDIMIDGKVIDKQKVVKQ